MKKINYTLFGLIIGLFALNGFHKPTSSRITINTADSLVRTWGIDTKKNKRIQNDVTYYWFQNNLVHHTDGGYTGKLLHGSYQSVYPDGQLKIQGTFHYGVKEGEWKHWLPDGRIKETLQYSNGKLHGKYELFSYSPDTCYVRKYKHGKEIVIKRNHISNADTSAIHQLDKKRNSQPTSDSTKSHRIKKHSANKDTVADSISRKKKSKVRDDKTSSSRKTKSAGKRKSIDSVQTK
ncbi:MAG: hypothetical protein RL007_538 [Bacteroidota bacterium]|jgi:hypothetical protein